MSLAAEAQAAVKTEERQPAPVRPRLEVLDGLRLCAAMVVVVFHYAAGDRGTWQAPARVLFAGPVFNAASYGWLGVELFFMISGFVICMSTWGKSLREFAVSRVVRLYPAYWFCALLTTLVLVFDPIQGRALPWSQVLVNMTMAEGYVGVPYIDPSYWTLTVELTFYVVFALVMVSWGLTYRRLVAFCVAWLVASLLTIWVHSWLLDLVTQPHYAACFVAGILLYLMHRFGPNPLLWGLLGCAWGVEMYYQVLRTTGQHPSGAMLHVWVSALIVTAFFGLLTLIALGKFDAIRGRWLVLGGGLTYPLYLLHQQLGETVIGTFGTRVPHWVLLVVVFAAMIGLAWLVHRFVERPVARRVRRVLTGRRGVALRSRRRDAAPTVGRGPDATPARAASGYPSGRPAAATPTPAAAVDPDRPQRPMIRSGPPAPPPGGRGTSAARRPAVRARPAPTTAGPARPPRGTRAGRTPG